VAGIRAGCVECHVDNSVTAVPLIRQLHSEISYDSTTRLSGQWPSCCLALPATSAVTHRHQSLSQAPQTDDGTCELRSTCCSSAEYRGWLHFSKVPILAPPFVTKTLNLESAKTRHFEIEKSKIPQRTRFSGLRPSIWPHFEMASAATALQTPLVYPFLIPYAYIDVLNWSFLHIFAYHAPICFAGNFYVTTKQSCNSSCILA